MSNSEIYELLKKRIVSLGYNEEKTEYYFNYALSQLTLKTAKGSFSEIKLLDFNSKEEFELYINSYIIPKITTMAKKEEEKETRDNFRRYSLQKYTIVPRVVLAVGGLSLVLIASYKVADNIKKNATAKANLENNLDNIQDENVLVFFLEDVTANMRKEILNESYNEVIPKLEYNINYAKQLDIEIERSTNPDYKRKMAQKKNACLKESVLLAAKYGHVLGGKKYEKYANAICIDGALYYPIENVNNISSEAILLQKDGKTYVKEERKEKESRLFF